MSAPDWSFELAAAISSAVAVGAFARVIAPPTPRLAPRLRPYTQATRSSLGRRVDALAWSPGGLLTGGSLQRLVGPILSRLAQGLARLVDSASDEALLIRLHQAGLLSEVPEVRRAHEYRVRQLGSAVIWSVGVSAGGFVISDSAAAVLAAAILGFIVGVTRWRAKIDRGIQDRRLRLCVELYTINQLLAMHVRVGGGVVQALQQVVERGTGAVVSDLSDVLLAHRSGRRIGEALEHVAQITPEPHAARTYRLLAKGAELGADLGEGLRALSEDIRSQRVEAFKRAATRRRAAMLVPIIAILAPVMLLFIAAPLPSIVLGGR
ncbi:MAG TPA: type II secretion system F family protein [Egibacteraceae bacterium]|nr:type II secretion system F family protein [Egibacteraceae bacterium]